MSEGSEFENEVGSVSSILLSGGENATFPHYSKPLLTFAAISTILIMIVGLLGNLLTVIALLRCPRVRNVAAAFIIRYIMIAHYGIYTKIYRPVWIACMIMFCWALSFGMQIPTFLGYWGKYSYDHNLRTCSITRDEWGRSSKTALFVIGFVIPCLIIVCCYARIFWVVHSSESRLRKHATKNSSNEKKESKTKRNEWRITKMVLAIFLSFLMCYFPITIIKVYDGDVQFPGKSKEEESKTVVSHVSIALTPVHCNELPDMSDRQL